MWLESKAFKTFFATLQKTQRGFLMLDYDGTLAPFCEKRNNAFPYPGIAEKISHLTSHPSFRIIIISGRVMSDLIYLLRGVDPLPELWGSFGLERRFLDGTFWNETIDEITANRLYEAAEIGKKIGGEERCERKPFGVAFHTRGLIELEKLKIQELLEKRWRDICRGSHLALYPFDGGVEIRVQGKDKGDVVMRLLQDAGEECAIAYLGDDVGDEAAFAALGNRGVKILIQSELRQSLADVCLSPPHEVLAFFDRCLSTVQRGA